MTTKPFILRFPDKVYAMRRISSHMVLQAVEDLHDAGQLVTRDLLAEVTGASLREIDFRLKYLVEKQDVHRVRRGVYEPERHYVDARLISKTTLPDGTAKVEIGDDHVLTLTPREARNLGELMAGSAQQFFALQLGKQVEIVSNDHSIALRDLRRELAALRLEVSKNQSLPSVNTPPRKAPASKRKVSRR